jgi:hypothetical protein
VSGSEPQAAVQPGDIEAQGDAMEDAAALVVDLLTSLAGEPDPSLDARAVFLAMARTAARIQRAAESLRQQDWLSFADDEEPDMAARWSRTLAGLDEASRLFEEIAGGWI